MGTSRSSVLWVAFEIVLLTTLGVLGNVHKVTLYLNVDLIFGSAFAIIVLLRHGLIAGTMSGAVIAGYTYVLWNHPYAVVIFTAEVLFVGLVSRRADSRIILADALYWLLVGMPLVFLFYRVVMDLDPTGTLTIMFKQSVNGVFNAIVAVAATFLLSHLDNKRHRTPGGEPVEGAKFDLCTVLTLVTITLTLAPLVIVVTVLSRNQIEHTEAEIISKMAHVAEDMEGVVAVLSSHTGGLVSAPPRMLNPLYGEVLTAVAGAHGTEFSLIGPAGQVYAGDPSPMRPPSPDGPESEVAALSDGAYLVIPEARPNTTVMQRWAQTVAVAERPFVPLPGWRLHVETRFQNYQEKLYNTLVTNLGALWVFVFAGVFSSHVFGTVVGSRISRLARATQSLRDGVLGAEGLSRRTKTIRELHDLEENFTVMQSRLKQQFQEIEGAREEADRANRAKTVFLANMSHEIRTPMHSILGLAGLLRDPDTDEDRRRDYGDRIERTGNQLVQILDDVLDLSRLETIDDRLHVEPTNVAGLIMEVIQLFDEAASHKLVELRGAVGELESARVEIDAARLRQVLVNLVGNAIKFTEVGHVEIRGRLIDNPAAKEGQDLELVVEDTGMGIPEAEQREIFELFRRGRQVSSLGLGGSGLGLSIVARLVERMGGRIEIESTEGNGSAFTVLIPVATVAPEAVAHGEQEAGDRAPRKEVAPDLSGKTILVAEDERVCMIVIRAQLNLTGATMIEATNGEDALKAAKEQRPDLIILDIRMPVLTGTEVARTLRDDPLFATTPIIAATAGAVDDPEESKGLFDAVLRKPYDAFHLFSTIVRVMGPDDDAR